MRNNSTSNRVTSNFGGGPTYGVPATRDDISTDDPANQNHRDIMESRSNFGGAGRPDEELVDEE